MNAAKRLGMALLIAVTVVAGHPLQAANIFEESFDYGDTETKVSNVSGWSADSSYTLYDPDGGLVHAQLGTETGGAIWRGWSTGRGSSYSFPAHTLATTSGFAAGDKIWVAALFQYEAGVKHSLLVAGGTVSALGFEITAGGAVSVYGSNNGGGNSLHATGISGITSGMYLMLLRATKGAGTSPTTSTIDFWLDPADTSSEGSVGSPDWTTDADSKFGRDTDSLTGVDLYLSAQGRTDEIRIGTDFDEVIGNAAGVPPEIASTSPTNVIATAADLQGTVTALGITADVTAYWSTNNHADSAAWLDDGNKGSVNVGSYTNVTDLSVSATASNLTPDTQYFYILRATNDLFDVWSVSNVAFRTSPPLPPVVGTSGGTTNISLGTASLQGVVVELNGVLEEVVICFGASDGGTNELSGWDTNFTFNVSAINAGETFSTNLAGLLYGVAYTYRVYASNEYGGAWSSLDTFTTADRDLDRALLVDFQQTAGSPVQTGFQSMVADTTAAVTEDFANVLGTNGIVSVTTQAQYWRNYGSITSGPFVDQNALLLDLAMRTSNGDIPLTLSKLLPGAYVMTTYHHAEPNTADSTFNLLISDATRTDAVIVTGANSSRGASPTAISTQQFSVDVNANSDDVVLTIRGTSVGGSSRLPLNGVELVSTLLVDVTTGSATNISAVGADLLGTVNADSAVLSVTAYVSTNSNTTTQAWVDDATKIAVPVDTYTNVTGEAITGSVSDLSSATRYYYTFRAANAAATNWGDTASFETLPAPQLLTRSPTNGTVDVLTDVELTASFDSGIILVDAGGVCLTNLTAGGNMPINVTVSAVTNLVITPTPLLDAGATYAVLIASGAIGAFEGVTDTNSWQFSTIAAAGSAPVISSRSPTHTATGVALDTDLVITFDQAVLAGSGNLELWKSGGGAAVQSIDVATGSVNLNNETVTIALSNLDPETDYYAIIPAGAFTDVAATLDFAGILTDSGWTFQTRALTAPTVGLAGGVTGIGEGVATLNGVVTDDGAVGYNAVTIAFGGSDGGTNDLSNWETNLLFDAGAVSLGATFSTNVADLLYGVRYHYRVFASNSYGSAWSDVERFTTARPAGWTPAELDSSTLALWLDAADSTTIGLDGSTVTNWLDKSGNARHAVADNTPSYLAVDAMIKGKPSIGGDNSLAGDTGFTLPSFSAKHVYVVTYYKDGLDDTFDGYSSIFSGPGNSGSKRVMGQQYSADLNTDANRNFNSAGSFKNGSPSSSATVLPMAASLLLFKSSVPVGQVYTLGYNAVAASRDWQGRYAEWIFTDGSESAETEKAIEGYLAWKWGVASNLPVDHSYADVAPGGALDLNNVVSVSSATEIGTHAAKLQGNLNAPLSVFSAIAYWSTNENTTTQEWLDDSNKVIVPVGSYTNINGQALTVPVTGLDELTTYYYTFQATNAVTNLWALPGTNFSTKTAASVSLNAGDLSQVYDGTARSVGTTTVPGGLNVVVTYDESIEHPTNAGSYTVIADIDELLYVGSATGTLAVSKADPGVTSWPAATTLSLGQTLAESALIGGAASAAGAFEFASRTDDPPVGTNQVWVLYTPTDTQNYLVVSNEVEVIVSDASAQVFLSNLTQAYNGTARTPTVTTDPVGLSVVVTYDGETTAPTNVGSYGVDATINEGSYAGSTNGTLEITKGTPTVTVLPTASNISIGQSVASSTLSGGTVVIGALPVSGTFSFVSPGFTPADVGDYDVAIAFSPDDTANLNGITVGTVSISVIPLIYRESFVYGDVTEEFRSGNVGSWSSSSGVLKYEPLGGLNHAQLGDELGGAMWLDYSDARSATDSSLSFSLSALSSGEAIWVAVIFQYVPVLGSDHTLRIEGGTSSDLGISISGAGDVSVTCSDGGGAPTGHATGISSVSDGTYLLLLRATKGAGSSPTDSKVDVWFNPAVTAGYSGLGSPDWTTGTDSAFGLDTDTLSSVFAQPSPGGRVDEIRIGKSYWDIIPTERPGSLFLFH